MPTKYLRQVHALVAGAVALAAYAVAFVYIFRRNSMLSNNPGCDNEAGLFGCLLTDIFLLAMIIMQTIPFAVAASAIYLKFVGKFTITSSIVLPIVAHVLFVGILLFLSKALEVSSSLTMIAVELLAAYVLLSFFGKQQPAAKQNLSKKSK